MQVNFPGLNNHAFSASGPDWDALDRKHNPNGDRTWTIMQQNTSQSSSRNDQGFLSSSFPRSPPRIYVTAESDDFDEQTLADWRDEGFRVQYLPMGKGGRDYRAKIEALSRIDFAPCETFGIIAYGDAASFCLEHYHHIKNNPELRLSCLIAYYPTRIPDPRSKFPNNVEVLVHLTRASGEWVEVVQQNQLAGLQGKKKVIRRQVDRGIGTGGTLPRMGYSAYSYDAEAGFAELDLEEYAPVTADLARSRSLSMLRRAFRVDVNPEAVVERNLEAKLHTLSLRDTMSTYTTSPEPHATNFPTLTGGIGGAELERVHADFFLSEGPPPSLRVTLISRTISAGGERVVDEMHVSFKHTRTMSWILPGVAPTNQKVEVIVVCVMGLRHGGSRIVSEHTYWDQASVLVQVGLLDPQLVPGGGSGSGAAKGWKNKGGNKTQVPVHGNKLPVVGRDAARRMFTGLYEGEDGEADNELIPGWAEGQEDENDDDEEDDIDDDDYDDDRDVEVGVMGARHHDDEGVFHDETGDDETQREDDDFGDEYDDDDDYPAHDGDDEDGDVSEAVSESIGGVEDELPLSPPVQDPGSSAATSRRTSSSGHGRPKWMKIQPPPQGNGSLPRNGNLLGNGNGNLPGNGSLPRHGNLPANGNLPGNGNLLGNGSSLGNGNLPDGGKNGNLLGNGGLPGGGGKGKMVDHNIDHSIEPSIRRSLNLGLSH